MSCGTSTPIIFDVQTWINSQCLECQQGQNGCIPASSLCYTGATLECSGIEYGDSIETALQKLDTQVCSAIGDYSTYQFNCLTAYYGQEITQESQFVDAITSYACAITSNLESFTGVTFPAFESETNARFEEIEGPGITCTSAGVINTDDLWEVLTKYCAKFSDIDEELDVSSVDWDSCFTVVSPPTTIPGGFNTLLDQICQVKTLAESGGGSLPTFNNTGSCLASSGTSDSLVATINKIKTRLCLSPTWDGDSITWGCIEEPEDDTDIESAIQNIITPLTTVLQGFPTFSDDFVVTPVDEENACFGVTVSLATPLDVDRFVASDPTDTSPGTLIEKLTGVGITIDDSSNPGTVTLTATGTSDTYEVKADLTDTTPGFLIDKVNGVEDSGLTIVPSYNAGTEQLDLIPLINWDTFLDALSAAIDSDSALKDKLCAIVNSCPSSCSPPSNLQVIAVP